MKYSFAVACLLGLSSAVKISGDPVSWDKDTLPDCPADKTRTVMDDGKTHVTKYPYVGASCKIQVEEEGITLIQTHGPSDEYSFAAQTEAAPATAAQTTVAAPASASGATKPEDQRRSTASEDARYRQPDYAPEVPEPAPPAKPPAPVYPNYNSPTWRPDGYRSPNFQDVEHCPNFNERFTLTNGRTYAVPYPRSGWNCRNGYGL